jgi:AraC-like DNA-binding protein
MTSTYIRHIPAPPLNAYIDYFFYLDGPMTHSREKSLPAAAVVLIVNFGGAIQMSGSNQAETFSPWAEIWCMGPWSMYHLVDWPLHVQQLGVCFKPDGAYPFLQLPVSELLNRYVSLDDIWGQCATEIRERLYAVPTIQARFVLLEQIMLAQLGEVPQGLKTVQYAVGKIAGQGGALSIQMLSKHIGISQNHLLTQFKRMVGFSPKELAKYYQLRYILRSIDLRQPIDWTQVALQFGYYDLSHLNKDFVAFTGHSPTSYLRLLRQKHDVDPQYHHLPRLLPID